MRLVAILLVLLPGIAVLAVLGRKRFSQYKDGTWRVPKIAGRLQKLEVLYGRSLEDATAQYIKRRFRCFLLGVGVLWILGLGVLLLPEGETDAGRIRRPEAGEDATGITVQLSDGEQTTEVVVEVGSRSLTDAEFESISDEAVRTLEKEIVGQNQSLDQVTKDLVFSEKDSTGCLEISWDTDALAVIGRNGEVRREDLEERTTVQITARLTDGIRTKEGHFRATVIPIKDTETELQRALKQLSRMEEASREDSEFLLPEQVDGVTVSQNRQSKKDMICNVYFMVILTAGILFFLQGSREKEKLKKREERLQSVFYRFVKRLTLLLGAGESLQGALGTAAAVEEQFLTPEVQYTVNRIRTGSHEPKAYADLGRSLGLQSYVRLFSTISTAAPRGSSQLLNLLEQEVRDAEAEAKESARRKGEQASQKLLLPMMILMIVVIGIVLFPAIAGM